MSAVRTYTFRDAGLHSRLLRGLNRVGEGLRRVGVELPSVSAESIRSAARQRAGLHDFGEGSWREALEVLSDSIERESNLNTFGRMAVKGLLVQALENRLRLLEWAKRHPEVREQKIERPWIIIGLPRTGTSLLSILLGLDPTVRPLTQWEASKPVPPPDLASHAEDPRIAECAKSFDQLQELNPAIRAMHPFGATLATECVSLMIFDLCALSIETQARMPGYGRWLEKADMTGAYEMHRLALQVLQSRLPTLAWSLKTPNHLWCLETLLRFYPDARIIWSHRDPRKVVPSVASLNTTLQTPFGRGVDPVAVGADWSRKLHVGLSRAMEFDQAREGAAWCCHVQYREIMADPVATLDRIYAHFGEEVHPLHERRMQAWMRDRPQEVFGRHGYDARDFGLRLEEIGEKYRSYCERYDVPRED